MGSCCGPRRWWSGFDCRREAMSHPIRTVIAVEMGGTLLIDCNRCEMQHTDQCDDCIVTFLLEKGPFELSADEGEAFDNLAEAGLVPRLRMVPRRPGEAAQA